MAVHSIGTGGDFATPQLWEDDIPAVLTEPRTGQLKNQEFVTAAFGLQFSAHTTSAANFILLECEAGASFMDNANVRNNALRYNAANGAGMRVTSTNSVIQLSGSCDHITIQGIQLQNTGAAYNNRVFSQGAAATSSNFLFKDCILDLAGGTTPVASFSAGSSTVSVVNCLLIQRNTAGHGIDAAQGGTLTLIACTIVAPSNNTSTGTGINKTYGTCIAIDCAIFGFAVDAAGLNTGTDYNATSFSDAGSGLPDPATDHNVYDVTYDTTLFVQPSDAGGLQDFRLAGTNLTNPVANRGIANVNSLQDISGLTRSDPPEIGVWELSTPGGAGRVLGSMADWLAFDGDVDLTWPAKSWAFLGVQYAL